MKKALLYGASVIMLALNVSNADGSRSAWRLLLNILFQGYYELDKGCQSSYIGRG